MIMIQQPGTADWDEEDDNEANQLIDELLAVTGAAGDGASYTYEVSLAAFAPGGGGGGPPAGTNGSFCLRTQKALAARQVLFLDSLLRWPSNRCFVAAAPPVRLSAGRRERCGARSAVGLRGRRRREEGQA